jgi:hypothetical protein
VSPVELTDGRGGEGGEGGAKSYDDKKAWASINPFNTLWPAPFFFVVACRRRLEEWRLSMFFQLQGVVSFSHTYWRFTVSGNSVNNGEG